MLKYSTAGGINMKLSKKQKRIISLLMMLIDLKVYSLGMNFIDNNKNEKAQVTYHKICSDFTDYLRNAGVDDPQLVYEYFNYAMWNGYFSSGREFEYSLDRNLYHKDAGRTIMAGNGVCLNFADMLMNIFKEMGLNAWNITCYVDVENFEVENIRTNRDFERKVDRESLDESDKFAWIKERITKLFGNHAITCVEYNGEFYMYDPTNLVYLNKEDFDSLSIINGDGVIDLKYFFTVYTNGISVFKVLPYKNDLGYNDIVLEKQTLDININELERFWEEQKNNIDYVAKSDEAYKGINNFQIASFVGFIAACLLMRLIYRLLGKLTINIETVEFKSIFQSIKEKLDKEQIKNEFEIMKNCELLAKMPSKGNNVLINAIIHSIKLVGSFVKGDNASCYMMVWYLNMLGYNAKVINASKFNRYCLNIKGLKVNLNFGDEFNLIQYYDGTNVYFYDYQDGELLCLDSNGVLCSLDGKKWYKLNDNSIVKDTGSKDTHMSAANIKNKMESEGKILSAEDMRELKGKVRYRFRANKI